MPDIPQETLFKRRIKPLSTTGRRWPFCADHFVKLLLMAAGNCSPPTAQFTTNILRSSSKWYLWTKLSRVNEEQASWGPLQCYIIFKQICSASVNENHVLQSHRVLGLIHSHKNSVRGMALKNGHQCRWWMSQHYIKFMNTDRGPTNNIYTRERYSPHHCTITQK